jgi:hypothetical protein
MNGKFTILAQLINVEIGELFIGYLTTHNLYNRVYTYMGLIYGYIINNIKENIRQYTVLKMILIQ